MRLSYRLSENKSQGDRSRGSRPKYGKKFEDIFIQSSRGEGRLLSSEIVFASSSSPMMPTRSLANETIQVAFRRWIVNLDPTRADETPCRCQHIGGFLVHLPTFRKLSDQMNKRLHSDAQYEAALRVIGSATL
jgi:hypothetical protein